MILLPWLSFCVGSTLFSTPVVSQVIFQRTRVYANQTSPILEISTRSSIQCSAHCYFECRENYCCYGATYNETTQNCTCLTFSCLDPFPDQNTAHNSVLDVDTVCGNKQGYLIQRLELTKLTPKKFKCNGRHT